MLCAAFPQSDCNQNQREEIAFHIQGLGDSTYILLCIQDLHPQ